MRRNHGIPAKWANISGPTSTASNATAATLAAHRSHVLGSVSQMIRTTKDRKAAVDDTLAAAREKETSVAGKRVLETIHRNVNVADSEFLLRKIDAARIEQADEAAEK